MPARAPGAEGDRRRGDGWGPTDPHDRAQGYRPGHGVVEAGSTSLSLSRVWLGLTSYGNGGDRPSALDEKAADPHLRAAVEGEARYIGASAMYAGQFTKAQRAAERNGGARFEVEEIARLEKPYRPHPVLGH